MKFNPRIIGHTFRVSKKKKENPQAAILSADIAAGRFKNKTTHTHTKILSSQINSKQTTGILERKMKIVIHTLGKKYTDN